MHLAGIQSRPFLSKLSPAVRKLLISCLCLCGVCGNRLEADDPFAPYELMMYERPGFEYPETGTRFRDGLKELWALALKRPDPGLQRQVVDTIGVAHRRGMKGMETFVPDLIQIVEDQALTNALRRSIAQTLVLLDAEEHADVLARLAKQYGPTVGPIVEPALARWQSTAMEEAWLERLREGTAGPQSLALALNGVGAIGSRESTDSVVQMLLNQGIPSQLRLLAARQLAALQPDRVVALANEVVKEPAAHPQLGGLLAVELLSEQSSDEAISQLNRLVGHSSTAVQRRALDELFEIDAALVDRFAPQRYQSPDSAVRQVIAHAMLEQATTERIPLLASMLHDVNPTIRDTVGDGLVKLADESSLRTTIIAETMEVLHDNEWRGCEQACDIFGRLKHQPAGDRLVEVLGHPRGEVKVASAWALTQLRNSEFLPRMLEHAESVYEGFRSGIFSANDSGAAVQMAHLFNAFGDQKYEPADSLMRAYLPKDHSLGVASRAAAAWAIGLLYEDDPQADLTEILQGRLTDGAPIPETEEMRRMSAVSIGRMGDPSALPALRKFANGTGPVQQACYWAIEKVTGEKPPEFERRETVIDDFFLKPLPDES